jgi:ubiquinone biosynthesis protein
VNGVDGQPGVREAERAPASSGDAVSTGHAGKLRREREIAQVLARHGLLVFARTLGLDRVESALHREQPSERAIPARELRLALEELGPTFIKLGQLLSTRADLLSDAYRSELEKLQDAAPPAPAAAISQTVESELAGGVAGSFAEFEQQPLAAGSVGEAHAAVLHDGTRVVVKVRRPGVVELIERDLEIISNLAARASRRWASAAALDVIGLASEFAVELRGQLDYIREACNAERFAANFSAEHDVQIPRVFWELTTSRVITLERVGGMKVTDSESLDAAGIDRHELAASGVSTIAKMVFVDGFFHGDPHPGNFFVHDDGTVAIIDFGIVGSLEEGLRAKLRRALVAVERRDPDRLAAALIGLRASSGPVDRAALRDDLASLIDSYAGRSVGELGLAGPIRSVLEVARRHRLRIPRDLSLLLRTVALAEGTVEQLDPEFRIVEALEPYARRQLFAAMTGPRPLRRLQNAGLDVAELIGDLPELAHRAASVLDDGGFDLHLRTADLEPLMDRAERLGNRIAVAVLAAAAIDAVTQLTGRTRRAKRRRARGLRFG